MQTTLQQLGIDHMSVAERLDLIGEIWDSIGDAGECNPIPSWHLQLLEQRSAAAEANPQAGIPWEEVEARLAKPA